MSACYHASLLSCECPICCCRLAARNGELVKSYWPIVSRLREADAQCAAAQALATEAQAKWQAQQDEVRAVLCTHSQRVCGALTLLLTYVCDRNYYVSLSLVRIISRYQVRTGSACLSRVPVMCSACFMHYRCLHCVCVLRQLPGTDYVWRHWNGNWHWTATR